MIRMSSSGTLNEKRDQGAAVKIFVSDDSGSTKQYEQKDDECVSPIKTPNSSESSDPIQENNEKPARKEKDSRRLPSSNGHSTRTIPDPSTHTPDRGSRTPDRGSRTPDRRTPDRSTRNPHSNKSPKVTIKRLSQPQTQPFTIKSAGAPCKDLKACSENHNNNNLNRANSNSSNISEISINMESFISPGYRGTNKTRFTFDQSAAGSSRGNGRCEHTISANKLIETLSPVIKRKVISAMQSVQNAQQSNVTVPKSNYCLACLTLFICPPLGIVAWLQAAQVNRHLEDNDYVSATIASKKAATFSYLGFLIGALLLSSVFVLFVLCEFW